MNGILAVSAAVAAAWFSLVGAAEPAAGHWQRPSLLQRFP